MPKSRIWKEAQVKTLEEKLGQAKTVVFVYFDGLTVKEIDLMRKTLREHDVEYYVIKRTLFKIALKHRNLPESEFEKVAGSIGAAFGANDEVAPAKLLYEFAKDHPALKIAGGIMNQTFTSKQAMIALAKLPSKQELLAQVVWTIKSPISGFVSVLSVTIRSLVYALNAIKDVKAPGGNS